MQKPIRRAVLRRGFVDGYQLVQLHLDCGHYVNDLREAELRAQGIELKKESA